MGDLSAEQMETVRAAVSEMMAVLGRLPRHEAWLALTSLNATAAMTQTDPIKMLGDLGVHVTMTVRRELERRMSGGSGGVIPSRVC